MFLFESIFVIFVVYWISAIVAEVTMGSNEEGSLAPVIRVGFGFLMTIAYISAAWLIMSIQQAWGVGTILLLLYAYGRFGFSFKDNILSKIKSFVGKYWKAFICFLLGGVCFFAPLLIANQYGPFTEGGGDISIYADTAKYAQDHHLTEVGLDASSIKNIVSNLKETFFLKPQQERWAFLNNYLLNPPVADFSTYRVIMLRSTNSFFYFPYATYGFLSSNTNYPIYFGIQAFFYVCMLAGMWCFFRQFGVRIANVAVLLAVSSQGIISVFYNMYSMQANSLAISGLILAILAHIRVLSWAGLRTYGAAFLIMWLSYIHYLSVVLPLIMMASFFVKPIQFQSVSARKKSYLVHYSALVFILLWLCAAWVGSAQSLEFVKGLLTNSFSGTMGANQYLGGYGLSTLSLQWFSFLFGFLSQQHFAPFATEYHFVNIIVLIGIVLGFITLVMGALVMLTVQISSSTLAGKKRLYLIVYLISIFTVIVQLYLARSSLYTQAKGAQNVLLYFYAAMLLPLAAGIYALREGLNIRWLVAFLKMVLVLFVMSLLATRIVYATKLAFGENRGAILEASYFSEANRIKQQDPEAFVLFEPRKSADLYISIQPFFASRMVPTRHLSMKKEHFDVPKNDWVQKTVLASDLIETKDLLHLWTLNAECKNKRLLTNINSCTWKAEKLTDIQVPVLLLFGDDYEKNFGERSVSKDAKEKGMFSFLRNGAAMVYLPKGGSKIEVVMQPRDEASYLDMVKEVSERIKKGEFGEKIHLVLDNKNIKLIYKLFASDEPSLKLIARFNGEYWLNVKLNNHEIL